MPENEDHEHFIDYCQNLLWLAMKETASLFGIKLPVVAIGVLAIVMGGSWQFFSSNVVNLSTVVPSLLATIFGTFLVVFLIGSYRQSVSSHKKFYETLAPLREELAAFKAAQQQGTPAAPKDVRRVMKHLGHVGSGLTGQAATEWRAVALEFVQLAFTPSMRVDFEQPDMTYYNYPHWLLRTEPRIDELDMNLGITIQQLQKWHAYQPPQLV